MDFGSRVLRFFRSGVLGMLVFGSVGLGVLVFGSSFESRAIKKAVKLAAFLSTDCGLSCLGEVLCCDLLIGT